MPDRRAKLALGAALLLYVLCLLFSWDLEPLLLITALLLSSVALYRSARAAAAAPEWEAPFKVRLNGAGKERSHEREKWLHIQTQRGRSIRTVIFAALVAAIALFIENHVTGSALCINYKMSSSGASKTAPLLAPASREDKNRGSVFNRLDGWYLTPCKEVLDWKSHADRSEREPTYTTGENNNFAGIALLHDISPSLMGPKNPAAVLKLEENGPLRRALQVEETTITVEDASQRLQMTPAELANRFATTPLAPGQRLQIPTERPYDPLQWADWLLWALIGMCAALLIEVARHLREVANGEGDFLGETSWYWTQLATGPLIAFVILLLFVHIDVNLLTGDEAAIEVNLREYPSDLLLVPAFLLGFYSRVTRKVLDQLMSRIFASAWRAANGDFVIVMKGQDVADDEIPASSPVTFETQPPMPGTLWNASEGTIDSAGLFKPPSVESPRQVFITAIAPGSNRSGIKSVTVVKHKFQIDTPGNPTSVLHPGQEQRLAVAPPLSAADASRITWEIVPTSLKDVSFQGQPTTTGPDAVLTIPENAVVGETATVKCTFAGLSRTRSFALRAGLTISGRDANGVQLDRNAKVTAGTVIDFTVSGLSKGELAQVQWTAEPAGAVTFASAPAVGEKVQGTVASSGTVIAAHPQKGKARFEIQV